MERARIAGRIKRAISSLSTKPPPPNSTTTTAYQKKKQAPSPSTKKHKPQNQSKRHPISSKLQKKIKHPHNQHTTSFPKLINQTVRRTLKTNKTKIIEWKNELYQGEEGWRRSSDSPAVAWENGGAGERVNGFGGEWRSRSCF